LFNINELNIKVIDEKNKIMKEYQLSL